MKYRVAFIVDQASLSIVMGVLLPGNEAAISLASCEPLADVPMEHPRKHHVYAGGRRYKGISGQELILHLTKGGHPVTMEQFKSAFMARGFAETSHSAAISTAVGNKVIASDGNGAYRRLPNK